MVFREGWCAVEGGAQGKVGWRGESDAGVKGGVQVCRGGWGEGNGLPLIQTSGPLHGLVGLLSWLVGLVPLTP